MNNLPSSCKVVVIGGVLQAVQLHTICKVWLERYGFTRRDVLTSGTTWHAAGLIGQLVQAQQ